MGAEIPVKSRVFRALEIREIKILLLPKQARYQLRYTPKCFFDFIQWWQSGFHRAIKAVLCSITQKNHFRKSEDKDQRLCPEDKNQHLYPERQEEAVGTFWHDRKNEWKTSVDQW